MPSELYRSYFLNKEIFDEKHKGYRRSRHYTMLEAKQMDFALHMLRKLSNDLKHIRIFWSKINI